MKKCNLLLFNVASCILASFGEAGENDDDNVWSTGGDTIFIRDMDQPAHRISPFWLSVSEALNSIEQAMDGTSDSCERSIMNMFNTTNSSLAKRSQLQMFDAWGKLPSGVFQNPLSVIMFGDYFECKQIEFMPMAYCYNEMFLKTHHQWRQIGAIGSCLPRECTDADIEHTLYQLLYNFTNTTHNQLKSPIVFKVHCQEDKDLEPGSMATIALLVVFVSLAVLATGLDLRRYHLRSRAAQALLSVSKTEPADPYYEDDTAAAARVPLMLRFGSDGSYHPTPPAYHPLLLTANHSDSTSARSINTSDNDRGPVGAQGELDDSDDDGALRVAVAAPKSTLEKVLRCFSPYQNVGRLFANRGVARDIGCFDGIRTLSMFWILLGQTWLWFLKQGPANLAVMSARMGIGTKGHHASQMIYNAPYAIDTFFFLSGFLVCYGIVNMLDRRRRFPWFRFYIHRYLRLTPNLAVVMLIFLFVQPHVGSGPLWFRNQYANDGTDCSEDTAFRASCGCTSYWWANLLYIQNVYPAGPLSSICMSWTWYLANDMQFYFVSPLVVLVMRRYRRVGAATGGTLALLSMAVPFAIAYAYKLSPNMIVGLSTESASQNANDSNTYDVSQLVWDKPYCRFAPYLIGIFSAYLYKYHSAVVRGASRTLVAVGWAACTLVLVFLIFFATGPARVLDAQPTRMGAAFLIAMPRPLFAVCLSWLSLACMCGNGGFLNQILSSPAWVPLSRLTYSAYLIHPLVLSTIFGLSNGPLYYNVSTVTYYFFGNVVVTYSLAAALTLCVEFPFARIEKLIMTTT
eukprot:m.524885 g.524885  ORF g.524885 m.524885 type:complete len:798 (-) comp21994_c0_seq4:82-2475(-)